jgi:predicted Zn-dependent protease
MGRGKGRLPLLIAASCLAFTAACAVNPVTGQQELSFMSTEREAALGAQASSAVAEEMGVIEEGASAAYVRAIGARIAAVSPRTDVTYRFFVADMTEPNAFALPGGYVYVSRGLLALLNSEDELAAVIGHEVGHVAARHAAQQEARATSLGLLSALGTVAAGAFGGSYAAQAAGQLGEVAGAGLIASYGRDQEREADQVGQEMMARAGWDPRAMSSFLRTLDRFTSLERGSSRQPSFFDSHPMTPERAETTAAFAQTLARNRSAAPIAPTQAAFLANVEGVVVGADPSSGVVAGDRFMHPDLDFHIQLPPGWQVQNSRAAVAALSPRKDALWTLTLEREGHDPGAAAQAFLQNNRLQPIAAGSLRIGGLDAYRAVAGANTRGGQVGLHLTWIAQGRRVFAITGMAPVQLFDAYAPSFDQTAGSFRPLTGEERGSIRVRVLHAVTARASESLAVLGPRVGNTWTTAQTAAANALVVDNQLAAGQLLKVVVERPYAGG